MIIDRPQRIVTIADQLVTDEWQPVTCINTNELGHGMILTSGNRFKNKFEVALFSQTSKDADWRLKSCGDNKEFPIKEGQRLIVLSKSTGLKYDDNKPKAGMVINYFRNAIEWVTRVGTYGSKKYGQTGQHWDHNWLEVKEAKERYTDAFFRHYLAYAGGEWLDPESGLPHLAHMAWNVLALLELELRDGNDN